MRKVALRIILLFLLPLQAGAVNYYVDPDGNDSDDGLTPATAWATINNGDAENNDIIVPGDTIFLLAGTFDINDVLTFSTSGTALAPIVYRGTNRGDVILDLQQSANAEVSLSGNHIKFENITIFDGADHGIHIEGDSCSVSQCYIYDIARTGIHIMGSYNLVLRNVVKDVGVQGIRCDVGAEFNKIYGNTIKNDLGAGIELVPAVTSTRIFNNIVISNVGIKGSSGNVCGFNNIISSNSQEYVGGIADSAGGMSADPLFADTAANNYTLMVGSPCINTGLDLGYSFNQTAPDMGAFEKYNTYYVSTSGDDSKNGLTPTNAWATIDNGDSLLYPGDTVYVLAGTYTDSVYISVSGASNDNIVFKGVRDSTTIIGTAYKNPVFVETSHITWSCISIDSSAENNIQISGDSVTVEYGRFENSSKYGIYISKSNSITITHNVIAGNQVHGLFMAANCTDMNVFNNTSYKNVSSGIFDQSGEAEIVNCILMSNGGSAVRAPATSNITYSDLFDNGSLVEGNISLDSTTIFDDPLLIEPDSGDFHLGSLSPALDAGLDVGLPYSGSAPDMGAYEVTGVLASIIILPSLDTLSADSAYQFTVSAQDSSGFPASPGVITWTHTFAAASVDATGLFTPQLTGDGTVIATSSIGGIADTTEIMTVMAGFLDSIYITPDRDTIEAGSTRQFTANGLDIKGNSVVDLGALTWQVIKNIGTIDATGLFTATKSREGFISVTSDLGPAARTDTIVVVPSGIAYIETTPTATSVEVVSSFQFEAFGYDVDSNLVYGITDSVTWSTTDPAGNVNTSGLYTAGNVPSPPTYYVKAVYGGSLNDSSSVIVIGAGALSYIKIERLDGTEFGDSSLTTDNDTTLFYCRAYDADSTLIGDASVAWSLIGNDSIGSVDTGPEAFTVLTLSKIGTGRIGAVHSSGAVDTTGLITCLAGVPASFAIVPDTATVSADSALQFTIEEYDANGNPSDSTIVPVWSVLGGIGAINSGGIFTPTTTGTGYIVSSGAGLADTSGLITVIPGILDAIVISPNTAEIGVGDSIQFTANGFDAQSNTTAPGDLTWLVLGQIGAIDSTGLFTADQPGICSVMVISSINGISDISSAVNVKALYVSEIPLGNIFVNPNRNLAPILAFRIDNNYDEDKTINSITVRDISSGAGSNLELLTNIDSLSLYYDSDNDSVLTDFDSLIATTEANAAALTLSFSPLAIPSGLGKTFFFGSHISQFPTDGDSLDIYFLPALDILTAGGISIDGPGNLNSLGYNIIDGLIAEQLTQLSTNNVQISPGDSIYNVFTVDIPRNGYLEDTLNIFSLINPGTAVPTDIDSLILYKDDGNGAWDGSGAEINLGTLAYTGSHWMRSGLTAKLTNQTNRFYVGVNLFAFPVNGATLSLTIPENGLEMASQNDGPIDSALIPLDTIEIVTNEAVTVTPVSEPSKELIPGDNSIPVFGIEFSNSYPTDAAIDSMRLSLIAFDPDGATQAQLDSQIDSVLVYLNRDGNHNVISGIDSLVAVGIINNGSILVRLNGLTVAAGGGATDLCLVPALNLQNSKNGNLINMGILNATDIYVDKPIVTGSFPLQNAVDHIINAFQADNIIIHPLAGITLFGGQSDRPVISFELPRDGYAPAILRNLKLSNSGTLNEVDALESVKLWSDPSNDGFTIDDSLLGSFSYNGNLWEITGQTYPLNNATSGFNVTVDIDNSQFEGGTLQFNIPIEGALYWSGATGPDNASRGNNEAHLVFPSNRVTVISIPAASEFIAPGSAGHTALTFALYNGYVGRTQNLQSVILTNISRSLSSQSFADYELGQVYLYLDSDGNRVFNNDSLIATGYFADSALQLTGLDVVLGSETLAYFFVVIDIPRNTIDLDSLAVAISDPSDFVFEQQVNVNGDLPTSSGGFLIVDGSVRDQYESIGLGPQSLSPGDTSISLFAFRPAYNGNLTDTLLSLEINNLGDADTSDLASLELWVDANGDNIWQLSDSLINSLNYSNGVWAINPMAVIIDSTPPALFLIGDISLSAAANVVFQAEIPLNGCQYSSGNDGPIDMPVISNDAFTISNSGLRVEYTPLTETYSIGQTITVKLTVTNILVGTTIDSVLGEIVDINNPSIVSLVGSISGPVSLSPGQATDFTFDYLADSVGTVSWQLYALSPTIADTSITVQTNSIRVQTPPSNVNVQLINSIPTSVTSGQTNVFPMGLNFTHPDTSANAASLRLDSLRLTIYDGSGAATNAADVFSRIVLTTGYANLTILETIPAQSSINLVFNESVIVNPGEKQVLSLLVDIDSLSAASDFVLSIENASAISIADKNTLQPVAIDPSVVFPLNTASCRIDVPSKYMALSYLPVHNGIANYGQKDVEIIQLNLRHPGPAGSSQIQFTGFRLKFADNMDSLISIGNLADKIKILKDQVLIGETIITVSDTTEVKILFNAPLTLNPTESDSLRVLVSLKNETVYTGFKMIINDSADFFVRDLSSGLELEVATDTTLVTGTVFPISSGMILLKQPAASPEICLTSLMPVSIVGGADSLQLIDISINYPLGGDHSSIKMSGALLSVQDSLGRPLDPYRIFQRTGVSVNGGAIQYQPFVQLQNGMVLFDFDSTGILLNQGDNIFIRLVAEIETDAPYDHFILKIQDHDAIMAFDISDTTYHPGWLPQDGCGGFPFSTAPVKIFLPAGRPSISTQAQPVQLAYPGQTDLNIYNGRWDYNSLSLQGDLEFYSLTGQIMKRTRENLEGVNGSNIFSAVRLIINDQIIAVDSVFGGDSVKLLPQSNYSISLGASLDVQLECDINENASLGNYLIQFNDSTFMDVKDKNLATDIYPVNAAAYPIFTAEISLTSASLENSFTNYPNPFNPSVGEFTTISYVLSENANVDIEIYTITGDKVLHLVENSDRSFGPHQSDFWDGKNGVGLDVIPGTYLCRITARYNSGREEEFRRMISIIR